MKSLSACLSMFATCTAIFWGAAGPANSQDFFSELGKALSGAGGGGGGANFSGGQGQGRRSSTGGGWGGIDFNQGPSYNPRTSARYNSGISGADSYYNRVPVRPTPSHSRVYNPESTYSGTDLVRDIFRGIDQATQQQPPRNRGYGDYNRGYRQPQQPNYYQQPQPQQYYQQPQYVQPQQPAARPAPPPARNVVKQVPKTPKRNENFLTSENSAFELTSEFDAREANEASQAGGKIDAAIEDEVSSTGTPEANKAWGEAVLSGDPEAFKKFKDEHGGMLSPEAQKWLDTRIDLAEYERDVSEGLLTGAGKDKRLEELNDQFATWPDSPLKTGVDENFSEIEKFNELGKLAALAEDTDNPWDVMWEGTQTAGYPVSFLAEVSGLPMMVDPMVDSTASGLATTVILNPEENGQSVNYNLGPHPFSIGPGQSQRLEKSYVIAFDPGNGGAVKKYTLRTGTYKFVRHENGTWDLQTVTVAVTIDNSQYDGVFHYLVDGTDAVLQPGQAADLTSQLPIIVEFDRGDGGNSARKILTEGAYVVGLDASQQRLDLFDAAAQGEFIAADQVESSGSTALVSTTRTKPTGKRGDKAKQIQEALARLRAKN